jgi:hypothetical protein
LRPGMASVLNENRFMRGRGRRRLTASTATTPGAWRPPRPPRPLRRPVESLQDRAFGAAQCGADRCCDRPSVRSSARRAPSLRYARLHAGRCVWKCLQQIRAAGPITCAGPPPGRLPPRHGELHAPPRRAAAAPAPLACGPAASSVQNDMHRPPSRIRYEMDARRCIAATTEPCACRPPPSRGSAPSARSPRTSTSSPARGGGGGRWLLHALRAHPNAPCRVDPPWETLRVPQGPGRARTFRRFTNSEPEIHRVDPESGQL